MSEPTPPPSAPERGDVPPGELAPRSRRFLAYLIDVIPITILMHFVVASVTDYDAVWAAFAKDRGDWDTAITYYSHRNLVRDGSFLLYAVYSALMEASSLEGTMGKYLLGMRVVDENGRRLTPGKAALRGLGKIASYAACVLGYVWILFDKKRQGWHDRTIGTYVIRR
jgi:uncharacterized RDD family membrane protein YckC